MSDLEPGQARIRHPELGEQVVPASAVPHWERGDWEYVEGDREDFPPEAQLFEGQDRVRIRHPVTGGESVVAASAVPYHRERGWQVAEEEAPAAAEDDLAGLTVAELQDLARGAGPAGVGHQGRAAPAAPQRTTGPGRGRTGTNRGR